MDGERVRRRRRHRATQCRRDARPNDTAFAKGCFSPAAISRTATRSTRSQPKITTCGKRKEGDWIGIDRDRERETERKKERKRSTYLRRKEDIRGEKPSHRPGILSCHSSTPLKSYWCDGTLSSSWWPTSRFPHRHRFSSMLLNVESVLCTYKYMSIGVRDRREKAERVKNPVGRHGCKRRRRR